LVLATADGALLLHAGRCPSVRPSATIPPVLIVFAQGLSLLATERPVAALWRLARRHYWRRLQVSGWPVVDLVRLPVNLTSLVAKPQ